MKRLIAMLLVAGLSFSAVACGGSSSSSSSSQDSTESSEAAETETEAAEESAEPVDNQVIIGTISEINGDMMYGWTNGATNADIKYLINEWGAVPVVFTKEGYFQENPSVSDGITTTDNEDGTKTFTIKIKEGLVYSDGSAITATDYVFSVLLRSSPEFGALEADNIGGQQFVGFEAFQQGESETFTGVNLIDDYTFAVTVKAEELPYFYELTFASVVPYPMAVIAPGVTITDDGTGATISAEFTAELLAETINNPETGYRFNPQVTSGPYKFVSFDPSSQQAILTINENYSGTYDGVQPSIETIIFKEVIDATQFDELASGSVDLIAGVSGGESISKGLDLVDEGVAGYTSYPRAGYGKIQFACNFGPTQFEEVRQAIAYALDREAFALEYTGGYGTLVHGYYGASQWEYVENKDALEDTLTHYNLDLEKAEQLLVDGGWTLNAEGAEFVKGTDDIRHKEVDGELMPLVIEWANTTNNPVSDLISRMLPENLASIGVKLNSTPMEFSLLLTNLYQNEGQNYHMYNLATGFATTSAVWYYFNEDLENYGGTLNTSFIADEELHTIAQEMKAIEPGDNEAWSAKWLELQVRWNELMPEIPLYSDEYHEFFSPNLQNYDPNALWATEFAIVYATME